MNTKTWWMGLEYDINDPLLKRLQKGGDIEAVELHCKRALSLQRKYGSLKSCRQTDDLTT